jgi:hypothetical protein
MDFLLCFGFFRTYVHRKQRLDPLYHEIGSGGPVAGVSTYRSRTSIITGNSPFRWNQVGSCNDPNMV